MSNDVDFAVGQNVDTPVTDRGVEKPQTPQNKALRDIEVVIDWFQCTIQRADVDKVLQVLFNITTEACEHVDSGLYGYNNTYVYAEKIKVLYHDKRPEMGVHVQLSGSACRLLEDLMSWSLFFERILSFDVFKVTRIDIAIDTFKRYFDIAQLRKKITDGELVSKFKKSTFIEQLNISDGNSESASLQFGSMSSDIYIVFYDKLRERINAGFEVNTDVDFWVRTEIRFKGKLAMEFMRLLVVNDFVIGDYVQKILYNYIDFKDWGTDSHKSRWKTCDWWLDFLGVVSKLSIAPKSQDTTIVRKRNYAEHNLSKLLAMVRITDTEFFNDLFRAGFKKISKSDLDIINSHFIATGHDIITMEQMQDIYNDINTVERLAYLKGVKCAEVHQTRFKAMGTEYETIE